MHPFTVYTFVAAMASLVAVNGAVVQRDGTFTFITPQPTSPFQGAPSTTTTPSSSQSPSTTSTQTTTATTSPTTTSTTSPTTTTSSSASVVTPPTSSTTPRPTTTTSSATVVVTPTTTSTTPCPTTTTSSATVVVPPMISTTPCPPTTSSSATVVVTPTTTSSTPCTTSCVPVVTPPTTSTTPCTTSSMTPCVKCTPSVTTTSGTPVTSTPTAPGTANCNGIQQWQASFAYTAGNQVIFNNQLFTAKQWTFNNEPPAHPDQWIAGGTCAQPINNKANCAGVAAWQSNVAYIAGNQVTSNNHLWSAVQWTQSNSPGDTSGSWKDLGACA